MEILIFTGSRGRRLTWVHRLQKMSFVNSFQVFIDLDEFQQHLSKSKEATIIIDLLYPFEKEEVKPKRLAGLGKGQLIDLFHGTIAKSEPWPIKYRAGYVLPKYALDNPSSINAHSLNSVELLSSPLALIKAWLRQSFAALDEIRPPPDIPEQGPGVRFELRDGQIRVAAPGDLDASGNDLTILRAIQPELIECTRLAIAAIGEGSNAHSQLRQLLARYLTFVDQRLELVSFPLLFSCGVRLYNQFIADLEASKSGDGPPLNSTQLASLNSLLDLHGPFVLASSDGSKLVRAAERFSHTPSERIEFKERARAFSSELEKANDIIGSDSLKIIAAAVDDLNVEHQKERAEAFAIFTIGNSISLLSAAAALAVSGALVASGSVVAIPAGIATLILVEGAKKSKPVKVGAEIVAAKLDRLVSVDLRTLRGFSVARRESFVNFVQKNEKVLRRIAGPRREMAWVGKLLDWVLKSKS